MRDGVSHFPSPLLEAFLEGVVLIAVLIVARRTTKRIGVVSGLFLSLYALARVFVEAFFRLPDAQIGYIGGFTLGQILSLPVLALGTVILVYAYISHTPRHA